MELKGQLFNSSQPPLSLSPRLPSTGSTVAFSKEPVRVTFHVLTASRMISIQTTESTQGSRSYPQERGLGEKNPIFTYPQKKIRGSRDVLFN